MTTTSLTASFSRALTCGIRIWSSRQTILSWFKENDLEIDGHRFSSSEF